MRTSKHYHILRDAPIISDASLPIASFGRRSLLGRGRDEDYSSPPAQIPASAANAPGSCRRSDAIGLRGIGYPCSSDPWARCSSDMPCPALCPGHALLLTLPSTGRLSSTISAADITRLCSRLHRYYAAVRLLMSSWRATLGGASPTGPQPPSRLRAT
jgi:hypothetical protein